ncbi:MAG TPA: hypothetical protein VN924_13115 [Bryobacteraceae bacterium]|nr:hypothetical protein [Bryobacteraceae bacterium]
MRNDELDRALDEALARYSSAEPLAGLEQRVLNRVRAERPGRRIGRWAWAVALAAGMIATAVFWVGQAFRPVPQQILTRATPPVQTTAPPPVLGKRHRQARRPVPLTSEERALLALATRAPGQAREALLELPVRSTEPIRIEEIKIEPLRSDDAK